MRLTTIRISHRPERNKIRGQKINPTTQMRQIIDTIHYRFLKFIVSKNFIRC